MRRTLPGNVKKNHPYDNTSEKRNVNNRRLRLSVRRHQLHASRLRNTPVESFQELQQQLPQISITIRTAFDAEVHTEPNCSSSTSIDRLVAMDAPAVCRVLNHIYRGLTADADDISVKNAASHLIDSGAYWYAWRVIETSRLLLCSPLSAAGTLYRCADLCVASLEALSALHDASPFSLIADGRNSTVCRVIDFMAAVSCLIGVDNEENQGTSGAVDLVLFAAAEFLYRVLRFESNVGIAVEHAEFANILRCLCARNATTAVRIACRVLSARTLPKSVAESFVVELVGSVLHRTQDSDVLFYGLASLNGAVDKHWDCILGLLDHCQLRAVALGCDDSDVMEELLKLVGEFRDYLLAHAPSWVTPLRRVFCDFPKLRDVTMNVLAAAPLIAFHGDGSFFRKDIVPHFKLLGPRRLKLLTVLIKLCQDDLQLARTVLEDEDVSWVLHGDADLTEQENDALDTLLDLLGLNGDDFWDAASDLTTPSCEETSSPSSALVFNF